MYTKRFKILRILPDGSNGTLKLQAVKAVKDIMGLGIKEALDVVNTYGVIGSWIELGWRKYDKDFDELRKFADIELDLLEEIVPEYIHHELSPEEQDAMNWYDNQDVLTKVMIDNYISAMGYGPIVTAS